MTYIPPKMREQIEKQAEYRCEYCQVSQEDAFFSHEIDHVYAEKHGGETIEENLAFSCYFCNRHKGSDLCPLDPETGEITPLYHPRRDTWSDHFQLNDEKIEPLTPQGRVTVRLLQLNDADRLAERAVLIALGRYP